jgi:hypothetical protein
MIICLLVVVVFLLKRNATLVKGKNTINVFEKEKETVIKISDPMSKKNEEEELFVFMENITNQLKGGYNGEVKLKRNYDSAF